MIQASITTNDVRDVSIGLPALPRPGDEIILRGKRYATLKIVFTANHNIVHISAEEIFEEHITR